jgi:hypothetical protein
MLYYICNQERLQNQNFKKVEFIMTEYDILKYAYNGVLNDICRYEEKCRKWNTEIDHSLIMYKHYEEISKKILEIEHNQ